MLGLPHARGLLICYSFIMIAIVARLRIINIDKAMWLCTVWVEDFEEGKTMMLLRGGQHHQQRAPLHSFALFFSSHRPKRREVGYIQDASHHSAALLRSIIRPVCPFSPLIFLIAVSITRDDRNEEISICRGLSH